MKKNGYSWWRERIDYAFSLFDIVRIDHFRGFDRFYAIPADSTDARKGSWLDGPGAELFDGRENLQIVAEDLGLIDDGCERCEKNGLPGRRYWCLFRRKSGKRLLSRPDIRKIVSPINGTHDNRTVLRIHRKFGMLEKEIFW